MKLGRQGLNAREETDEPDMERRVPATERVLDHILSEMDAGRLRSGMRVNAARVAAGLSLSAAPVREALGVLAGRGIVDLLPDRGAVIRAMTPREVCMMWEVITPVVCVGLELGTKAIAAGADPSEVVVAYDAIRNTSNEPPVSFLVRLNEWHYAVDRLGGNEYVNLALERLGVAYWDRYLAELIDVVTHLAGYLENYRRLHEAVLAGDGGAAASIFEYHAQWSIGLIRQAEAALPRRRNSRRRKAAKP
jgi:DNA-binding GntR family transcriptional regulator